MATAMTQLPKIPSYLATRVGKPTALTIAVGQGISTEGPPRITLKGSRFRIKQGEVETLVNQLHLDVIVVGANSKLSKTFYAQAWDINAEGGAPDCYSINGSTPEADSKNPQASACAGCKHNEWGSKIGPTGQQLKACTDQKRLAVIPAKVDNSPVVYLLAVTPAALKGLNKYQKDLTSYGLSVEHVITRLAFDTDASFPKLTFQLAGFIQEDMLPIIDRLVGSNNVADITGEAVTADTQSPPLVATVPAAPAVPAADPWAAPATPDPWESVQPAERVATKAPAAPVTQAAPAAPAAPVTQAAPAAPAAPVTQAAPAVRPAARPTARPAAAATPAAQEYGSLEAMQAQIAELIKATTKG